MTSSAGGRVVAVAVACSTLALAVLLAGCGGATSGTVAPSPSLSARPGQTVWIASAGGFVLKSSDGGATWTTYSGTPFIPAAMTFSNGRHGWIASKLEGAGLEGEWQTTIFATSDGGATWSSSGSWPGVSLLDMAATDDRHIWAVGYKDMGSPGSAEQDSEEGPAVVLSSTDGGATWRKRVLKAPVRFKRIAFVDASHGWALGDDLFVPSSLHRTGDGGARWRPQYRFDEHMDLNGLAFADAKNGWIVGYEEDWDDSDDSATGLVLGTCDGGGTWEVQSPAGVHPGLIAVACTDAKHAWAVGGEGLILATRDGGRSWQRQVSGTSQMLTAVTFTDPMNGWILAPPSGLLTTGDGGQTWTLVKWREDRVQWMRAISALAAPSP